MTNFEKLIERLEYEFFKTSIRKEEAEATLDAKKHDYGEANKMLKRIASKYSCYLDMTITEADVAFLFVLAKESRLEHNAQHRDSQLDKACYLMLTLQSVMTCGEQSLVRLFHYFNSNYQERIS